MDRGRERVHPSKRFIASRLARQCTDLGINAGQGRLPEKNSGRRLSPNPAQHSRRVHRVDLAFCKDIDATRLRLREPERLAVAESVDEHLADQITVHRNAPIARRLAPSLRRIQFQPQADAFGRWLVGVLGQVPD